ncbi:MAG: DUF2167 domain-containing protein [Gammaproteobacteria bacterium]
MVSNLSHKVLVAALVASSWLSSAVAAEDAPEAADAPASAEQKGPDLNYRTGKIVLPNKVATLRLDSDYRYLSPTETQKLLVAWGNPPEAASDTEGAVVPTSIDPFSKNGWAVVLSYTDDGHVDDSDARKINYTELMADMKKSTKEENEERVKAGYQAVNLVGWATEPRYDSTAHKMYWAKELDFGGGEHTLNYDVRVLGREGVLSMNAVASVGQLTDIQQNMQQLIQLADFNEGQRYEEFNGSKDRLAAYGLGALVAGGVAAKLGLFAKAFALLIAFKKILLVGVVALGGFFSKWFKGRSKEQPGS